MRMGLKEIIEYLYLNFPYDELTDDGVHIIIGVVADIFGKQPEEIINKIRKFHNEKL